jgi:phosphoserine phosphatase
VSANFATVVLDVDSTLSGIEGIDWLANRRGPDVAAKIAKLTDEAMRGAIVLEDVYGARLDAIRLSLTDIEALSVEYVNKKASGSEIALRRLREGGVDVVLISGGIHQAILPLANLFHIEPGDVNAVRLRFDSDGSYLGFDTASPLTTSIGKRTLIERLNLAGPVLAVGDGATDVAMREVVDQFAAYVGFARRENVVAKADVVIESFADLAELVLSS